MNSPITLFMKKLFILLSFCLMTIIYSDAQTLLLENCNYTAGQALTDNNWIQIGTVATNPINVVSPGLTFSGFSGSNIGNAAGLTTSGQDIYRDASASASSGNIYVSFMINVATAQAAGDYFFALLPTTSTTSFAARTFIKSTGTGFQIGIAKSTETPSYAPLTYTFGTTYLIVVQYIFAAATTTDDYVSLFLYDGSINSSAQPSSVAVAFGLSTDAASLGRIALRQGTASNAPGITVDGFRVALSFFDVLPLTLKSFNASLVGGKANLNWSTSNEINVSGFTIEKSKDGSNFSELGFVAAKNATTDTYTYADAVAAVGTVYYRLKMTDKDGSYKYSQVVALNAKQSIKLDVFPNPVSTTAILSHTKADNNASIKIVTVDGRTVATVNIQIGATQSSVDVSKLAPGNYVVVFDNNGTKSVAQFVKQ